ncbi:hypothetical protein PC9H_009521 [Pleurotus ostreatus]|uniref:DUF6534 domain-containing protein n=1 Tax=Pleurotus ostreatus TaxID=5322 RepID=A0A8H6ZQW0_PLEOS|nr:uncharacterized protein PC9H_009521 [Pleurotus ostreatus]KAF7424216.1 hypothetical protein PC9H_009521 [Pleurotus ostreatus]
MCFMKKRFDRQSELNYIAAMPFAVAAILSDVLIAASLCYVLGSTKTSFNGTQNILNKLIIWSINRCILTSAVAIVETIVSLHGSVVDTSDLSTTADGSIGFRIATARGTENQNHISLRARGSGDLERRGSPYLDAESGSQFVESAKV